MGLYGYPAARSQVASMCLCIFVSCQRTESAVAFTWRAILGTVQPST